MNDVFMNRELSWLKFNERVLEEAEDERTPLCERLSFASIYQSNLDEFFMVRVGSLVDQDDVTPKLRENKTNMTAREQIEAVIDRVRELNGRRDKVYARLMEKLEEQGVRLVDFRKIGRQESERLERYFDSEIAPLISPSIVGRRQPFPFLRNKDIYAVVVLEGKKGKYKLGIIPCSAGVFPRLIEVSASEKTYMLAEDLILHFIPKVFEGYVVKAKSLMRVTRNADIDADALYDDDLDYREFMVQLIKRRKRLAPVRLELSRELDGIIVDTLCRYMDVPREYVFMSATPLDFSFLFGLEDVLRQRGELFYERRIPQKSPAFVSGKPILAQIAQKDKLLSYPYESMKPFLEMLTEAANDDSVVSIKMTLYRVAKQSKVVEALCEAAENGKDVLVLVELKARFDEENNIEWSRRLEEAGCSVIYGLDGYKVHSKLCLITRKVHNQIQYITQVGTGNYNEKTSELYTDLSFISTDPKMGEDATRVFQALCVGEVVESTERLWVAPNCFESNVLRYIQEQIDLARSGGEGYVFIKVNSLNDMEIMEKLIEASQAGVKVEMVIRGICCLCPGIPGYTDNIRIKSIVGRYLEHSRIFIFGTGEQQRIFMGSGDLLNRNTRRRVEVFAEVRDGDPRREILHLVDAIRMDNQNSWEMLSDGSYVKDNSDHAEPLDSHTYLHHYFEKPFELPPAKLSLKERLFGRFHKN